MLQFLMDDRAYESKDVDSSHSIKELEVHVIGEVVIEILHFSVLLKS